MSVQELLKEMTVDLEQGLIPGAIFNDEQIHRMELEKIFGSAWVFIGHESEIPSPGDYALRYIGQDPFIFVRDENQQIRVLFDGCPHRGASVCNAEKGNASHFRCPYHGWTFKNDGTLVGTPAYRDAYEGWDRSQWGLRPAPKVGNIHGFVFATIDPEAPSLEEYLGGMKWYMDLLFGLNEQGMEVIGEPNRWIIDCNWKTGAENFAGDDYHTMYLHRSMWDIKTIQIPQQELMKGYHVHAGNGHTLSFTIAEDGDFEAPKFWGLPDEIVKTFQPERLSKEQFDIARRSSVTVGNIFPNLAFLTEPVTPDPENIEPSPFMHIRMLQPKGPNKVEAWTWFLAWKGASDELKEKSYKAGMTTFSVSGIFDQDDTMPWESIARASASQFYRKNKFKLNYQMGLNGIGSSKLVPDWPGPGVAYYPRYEEGVMRHFYQRWLEYMTK